MTNAGNGLAAAAATSTGPAAQTIRMVTENNSIVQPGTTITKLVFLSFHALGLRNSFSLFADRYGPCDDGQATFELTYLEGIFHSQCDHADT